MVRGPSKTDPGSCFGAQRIRAAIGAVLSLLGGCSGGTDESGTGNLVIVSGASYNDTIAALPQPLLKLRVVLSTGRPGFAGIAVMFDAPAPPPFHNPPVALRPGSENPPLAEALTDANGEVTVQVRLGTHAGTGWLYITVPAFGLRDSIRTTVRPGAPRTVEGAPTDTSVLPGQAYQLRGLAVFDQMGNRRPEAPVVRAVDPCVEVAGQTVRAAGVCQTHLVMEAGDASGHLVVRVVPDLKISTIRSGAIVTRRTTGHLVSEHAIPPSPYVPFGAEWSRDGNELVFDDGGTVRLYVPATGLRVLVPPDEGAALLPRFSTDRAWVYYQRQSGPAWDVRRVRQDGRGDTLVVVGGAPWPSPSPSPDGTSVAYIGADGSLHVLELATGADRVVWPSGVAPSWAPFGTAILIGDGPTGLRMVPVLQGASVSLPNPLGIGPPFHWSPDGQWIVGVLPAAMGLVRFPDGLSIYLPRQEFAPTWRP